MNNPNHELVLLNITYSATLFLEHMVKAELEIWQLLKMVSSDFLTVI